MCGIIGIIAKRPVAPELIEGLRRLEYRGYDSAGVATLIDGRGGGKADMAEAGGRSALPLETVRDGTLPILESVIRRAGAAR